MDHRELINLGLSDKEAKVYLASLELGKSVVQKISIKADVNRATTYVIIESLMDKGLMSSYTEGKKQYFFAESPERLSMLFREQSMAIQRKQEYLDKLLPELRSLRNSDKNSEPTVFYYEGVKGFRSMIDGFYSDKNEKESRVIFSSALVNKVFSKNEIEQNREKRLNKHIHSKALYNADEGDWNSDDEREKKKVSTSKFPFEAEIAIFGDKVRFFTMKDKNIGIMIKNKEIAKTLKSLFDLAWNNSDNR